jgi:predicted hydrocarbon binding protein
MSHPQLALPNNFFRQSIASIEQVVGTIGLNAILRRAKMDEYIAHLPPDNRDADITIADYARLNQAIEDFFGRGSPAILRKIGQVAFENLLVQHLACLGDLQTASLTDLQKCQIALTEFARSVEQLYSEWQGQVQLFDASDLRYIVQHCPLCSERQSNVPVCHVNVGVLAAVVRFATQRNYRVEEMQCIAMGAPYCEFSVQIVTALSTMPGSTPMSVKTVA